MAKRGVDNEFIEAKPRPEAVSKQESLASVCSVAFHSSFLTANLYTFTGICTIESEQVNTFKFSVI